MLRITALLHYELALKVVFDAIKNENLYSDKEMCYNYLWNFFS